MELDRFLTAQNRNYADALAEIKAGRKTSHWMWYVFPQIAGLGHSETTRYYAIADLQEAERYLDHPILGRRLSEIANVVLDLQGRTALDIFGKPDNLKLKSSMTLFSQVSGADPVFELVLEKYFDGEMDLRTIEILEHQ